jgi:hypothetical protein
MVIRRSRKGIRSKLCSKCNILKEKASKRYCNACANAYQREWRKNHPLNEFQQAKAHTRSKTKVYVKRGKIKKLPCIICRTNENVEAHHEDYNDFKNVTWMCRSCHRDHHIEQSYDQWKWKQLNFWSIK